MRKKSNWKILTDIANYIIHTDTVIFLLIPFLLSLGLVIKSYYLLLLSLIITLYLFLKFFVFSIQEFSDNKHEISGAELVDLDKLRMKVKDEMEMRGISNIKVDLSDLKKLDLNAKIIQDLSTMAMHSYLNYEEVNEMEIVMGPDKDTVFNLHLEFKRRNSDGDVIVKLNL